jgi:hypothetical protein
MGAQRGGTDQSEYVDDLSDIQNTDRPVPYRDPGPPSRVPLDEFDIQDSKE